MADPAERALVEELRGVGLAASELPDWKKQALGKAPTFGIRDARSIKEQRESLPIYKLRDQLVAAVQDNQVRCAAALLRPAGPPAGLPARLLGCGACRGGRGAGGALVGLRVGGRRV